VIQANLKKLYQLSAIRERCRLIYDYVLRDQSPFFQLDLKQMTRAAEATKILITEREQGDRKIPYHSRLRHLECAADGAYGRYLEAQASLSESEQGRMWVELVIMSVLLDAGAGHLWQFKDTNGKFFKRSEGLAVASLHLYESGLLSSVASHPWRIDAEGLQNLSFQDFSSIMQIRHDNPLVGAEGRFRLLKTLGSVLQSKPQYFFSKSTGSYRLGYLYDYFTRLSVNGSLSIEDIFTAVLKGLGEIWPSHTDATTGQILQGDLWYHPALAPIDAETPFVPFHKLSQWLSYSLWECLERLGMEVTQTQKLTGLPEYRNGGLLLDTGVILPKKSDFLNHTYTADRTEIIEWRALTVILLDELAGSINSERKEGQSLNLAQILEAGTWAAGRKLAIALRGDQADPPIKILSDGTIF
jgi:hypothetical protein